MNRTLRCLLVDDEFLALELMESYLKRISGIEIIGKVRNPLAAYQLLQQQPIDLLFLDIHMPQVNGLVLLENLQQKPLTVFTTAHPGYAHRAFDLEAVDYLVKPFTFERMERAVARARQIGAADKQGGHIRIRSERKWLLLPQHSIKYVEGWKEYLRIHCQDEVHTTRMTFSELTPLLPAPAFVRVHKSFLIATEHVASHTYDQVSMSDGKDIPIAKNRRADVTQVLHTLATAPFNC